MQQKESHRLNAWYVRGCIMSAIIVMISWISVEIFAPTRNELWLYQFFVVITFVSAVATVLFAGLTFEAVFRRLGHEWYKGFKAGLPPSVLLRPLTAAFFAVLVSLLLSNFFDNIMVIINVGVIFFIIFLLAPLVDKIVIQRRQGQNDVVKRQSADTAVTRATPSLEQASKSPNVGIINGAASESVSSANSVAVSNVEIKLVLPTQERIIEKVAPQESFEKEIVENSASKNPDASTENHPEESSIYKEEKQTADTNSEIMKDDEPAYYQGEEIVFPENFPSVTNKFAFKKMFVELVKEQVLDIHLQPIGISKVQVSLLANALSEMFDIPKKWITFEKFWHVNNLRQSYTQAASTQLDEGIYRALAEAERDERIASIVKVSRWMNRYRKDHNIRA